MFCPLCSHNMNGMIPCAFETRDPITPTIDFNTLLPIELDFEQRVGQAAKLRQLHRARVAELLNTMRDTNAEPSA